MKTTPVHHGMFCWHELVTAQTKEAAEFYRQLLGGQVQSFPVGAGEYSVLELEGQTLAGFQPASETYHTNTPSQWMNYVAVDDVDAAVARVVANGGTVDCAAHDFAIGRTARVKDPQGARLALFKGAPGKTDGTNPVGHGAVCWLELVTTDVPAAAHFYSKVLGWTYSTKKMPWGDMQVASAGETRVATLFAQCADDRLKFCRWYPYIQVDSVDSVVKRVRSLGGTEASDPMDVPDVGRWLPVTDAVGAEVAFLELLRQ